MHHSDNAGGESMRPTPRDAARSMYIPPLLALPLLGMLAMTSVHSAGTPPDVGEGEISADPDITIIQRDDAVIEEYRVGGRLFMIKVVPAKGIPYFLVDSDGDGRLDARRSDLGEDMMIPSWTLFRW